MRTALGSAEGPVLAEAQTLPGRVYRQWTDGHQALAGGTAAAQVAEPDRSFLHGSFSPSFAGSLPRGASSGRMEQGQPGRRARATSGRIVGIEARLCHRLDDGRAAQARPDRRLGPALHGTRRPSEESPATSASPLSRPARGATEGRRDHRLAHSLARRVRLVEAGLLKAERGPPVQRQSAAKA